MENTSKASTKTNTNSKAVNSNRKSSVPVKTSNATASVSATKTTVTTVNATSSTTKATGTKVEKAKTYGPYKFEIPNKQKITDALSLKGLPQTVVDQLTVNMLDDYETMHPPGPGDWLWVTKETHQTYNLFSSSMKNIPSKFKNGIYLVCMDEGLESTLISTEVMNYFTKVVQLNYSEGVQVKILKDKNINFAKLGIKSRINDWSGEVQYCGSETLRTLAKLIPKDGFMLLGITSYDIYNNDDNNFVFGLASSLDATGLFSMNRYYSEYEALLQGSSKDVILKNSIKRTCSTMVHEMGHIFGIKHCTFFNCRMNGTNSMEESNAHPAYDFCPVCIRKLWSSLKFDIKARIANLITGLAELFGKDVDITKDIEFFEKRYLSIKDV